MSTALIAKLDDYLKAVNKISAEPEGQFDLERCLREYPVLRGILDQADSFNFVLDMRSGEYLYFSDTVKRIIGYEKAAFLLEGVEFSKAAYLPAYAKVYATEVLANRQKLITELPLEERAQYSYRHTFKIQRKDKSEAVLMQEFMALKADAKGNPLIIIGACSDITGLDPGKKMIDSTLKRLPGQLPIVVARNTYYPLAGEAALSPREIEVLKWVLEGLSSEAIAEKMFISIHTVRTHRKNMLEKTNAKNTADLIRYAVRYGIF